ncbi:hypothetical protein ACVGVM_29800 (plasmid) [Pseudonocardia bannensis]|uniref:Uncharacterized protein n=1 Tax=Pseudonocardia bannensis TaxID=630973 RepID=A0A848DRG9_9PSEU|nr:hypothetical protein [Pseudonocardia bannensis]
MNFTKTDEAAACRPVRFVRYSHDVDDQQPAAHLRASATTRRSLPTGPTITVGKGPPLVRSLLTRDAELAELAELGRLIAVRFRAHRDAAVITSLPGIGMLRAPSSSRSPEAIGPPTWTGWPGSPGSGRHRGPRGGSAGTCSDRISNSGSI